MDYKDHPDNEKLTPDDSQPSYKAESEIKKNEDEAQLKSENNDGELDFDLRPADSYMGPDYDPKKPSSSKTLWLGILMVVAIIGLTYYAFRTQPDHNLGNDYKPGAEDAAELAQAKSASEPQLLPEKADDAADFSPTPATEDSAIAVASTPVAPKVKSEKTASSTPAKKTAAQNPKPAATKPTEVKPVVKTPVSTGVESSTSAATTEETKADNSPDSVVEAKAVEEKEELSDNSLSDQFATPAAGTETQTSVAAAPVEPAAVINVSDLWVVNISSTPDPAESLRLLKRVMATDVGGQVYFYEITLDGRVYHRIRIGFFDTLGEAEIVGQRVKEAFQLTATPWAVKPTVEEVAQYRKK